jgi:hypothetical protein
MEALASLGFLLIGLGFFVYVIRMDSRDHREAHENRLMEAREFGFGGPGQHNAKTLHED